MLESVDTDADGQIDADELRDLADDLEGEPLTGEDLRDALISAISDMHKDIYGKRANATALRQLSTEELEIEHDKIEQQHKDWWYEERHREDQDMWIAHEEEEVEELMEPEEGEDMPKQIGMGKGRMREMTRDMLRQIIDDEFDKLTEGEVINLPSPKLPWEFGPEGYLARPELRQKMSDLEYGPDSAPEDILAIALSNRAEEMLGYKQTIDPVHFKQLGMRLNRDFVVGKAGNIEQSLHDITSRIDAGDYFDEDIQDILDGMQMIQTKDLAAQQDPDDIGQMELDFEKYMQGIESGDVVELEQDDD